jgi:cell division control protein 11
MIANLACLGHGLRELDIELMRRLSPLVNVIPVIGKADSLTPLELAESKKLIMEDIEHYRIPVYVDRPSSDDLRC